jgi:hypothetical protein
MKRIKEEAEVIVRLDYQTQRAHICVSAWPAMAAKMERLYGTGMDLDTDNCARRWEVPLNAISFRKASRRVMSPKHLAALKSGRLKERVRMPVLSPADHIYKEISHTTPLDATSIPDSQA